MPLLLVHVALVQVPLDPVDLVRVRGRVEVTWSGLGLGVGVGFATPTPNPKQGLCSTCFTSVFLIINDSCAPSSRGALGLGLGVRVRVRVRG